MRVLIEGDDMFCIVTSVEEDQGSVISSISVYNHRPVAGHGEAERVVELMEAAMNEGFVDAALYGLIYPYGVTDGTFIVTKIASL